MKTYEYSGPVMIFDRIATNNWSASTTASSEKKARSNFAYQYKRQNGLASNAKVSLPGKIKDKEENS